MGRLYSKTLPIQLDILYLSIFWFLEYEEGRPGRPTKGWRDRLDKFLINTLFHRVAQNRRKWDRVRSTFTYFGPGVHNRASFLEF